MHVLVHLGLNKCASTFIQNALAGARPALRAADTWYPDHDERTCHYGLSKHYGFGPDDPNIVPRSVAEVVAEARQRRCHRLIVSSEYLSLYRPEAVKNLLHDLAANTSRFEFLIFSREIFGWIRSLFNQYVKAVEGPGQLDHLNAFVDQVLRNRAVDAAGRIGLWNGLAPTGSVRHLRLPDRGNLAAALSVFEEFAGLKVEIDAPAPVNQSIEPAALHRIGQLRRRVPTADRDVEIMRLMTGGASPYPAPPDFLEISPDRRARLIRDVIAPFEALLCERLPSEFAMATTRNLVSEALA
ncbi:MAG: hypothetical protein AAGD13_15685 [Pseudomonadota bacterium]